MGEVKRSNPARDGYTFVGGALGLVTFLAVALEGALVYGGASGVSIAHGLNVGHGTGEQTIVWIGMILGAAATASVMIVVGAVLGALVFGLFGRKTPPPADPPKDGAS